MSLETLKKKITFLYLVNTKTHNEKLIMITKKERDKYLTRYIKKGFVLKSFYEKNKELYIKLSILQEIRRDLKKEIRELKEILINSQNWLHKVKTDNKYKAWINLIPIYEENLKQDKEKLRECNKQLKETTTKLKTIRIKIKESDKEI